MRNLFFLIAFVFVGASAQGLKEYPLSKPCPYGYVEYVPPCSETIVNCDTVENCPYSLLISLDGFGARGNGVEDLHKVTDEGIAKLIKDGVWKRSEFIVISPQLAIGASMYSPYPLHVFVQQMIDKYRPDPSKVFMAGLSAGANSIYAYIVNYRDVKAAITISGAGNYKKASQAIGTRLWAFHGDQDGTVPVKPDIQFNKNYNIAAGSMWEPAHITIYPGVGHTGWQQTYTMEWIDKPPTEAAPLGIHKDSFSYDHYKQNIYDWLLK